MNNTQETNELKEYVVIWTYMANYGVNIYRAKNAQDAIKNHLYFRNEKVVFYAFELDEETTACRLQGQKTQPGVQA